MRAIVFEARDRIAEGIDILTGETRLRVELDRVRETTMKGELAGRQVQKMMGMHHIASVLVSRSVPHGVTRHADTARKSKSICEKCWEVSWSESWAAADIRSVRCCDRMCREPGDRPISPPRFAYLNATKFDTAS